jgi:hypothetical protein
LRSLRKALNTVITGIKRSLTDWNFSVKIVRTAVAIWFFADLRFFGEKLSVVARFHISSVVLVIVCQSVIREDLRIKGKVLTNYKRSYGSIHCFCNLEILLADASWWISFRSSSRSEGVNPLVVNCLASFTIVADIRNIGKSWRMSGEGKHSITVGVHLLDFLDAVGSDENQRADWNENDPDDEEYLKDNKSFRSSEKKSNKA